MNNEAKVGIFVFIILAIFFVLSIKIGEIDFNRRGTYDLSMTFPTVEGLKVGSTLELAGVMVGNVRRITLRDDYSATVDVAIREDVHLPVDTEATITTKGVLGDKIISLNPGMSGNMIAAEGTLEYTRAPPSIDSILISLGEISHNLSQFTAALTGILGDEEGVGNIKGTLENLFVMSRDASLLINENRANIDTMLGHLSDASEGITLITANLARTSQGMSEIVTSVQAGQGTLGRLITDENLYSQLVDIAASIQKITAGMEKEGNLGLFLSDNTLYYNLAAIAENLKYVSAEIAAGRGTLGHILTDEQLYSDLENTIDNANRTLQGIQDQTPITVMGTVLGLIW